MFAFSSHKEEYLAMGCTQVTAKLETEYYPAIWDPHATKSTGKKEKKKLLCGRRNWLPGADTKRTHPSVMKVWVTFLGQDSKTDELLAEGKGKRL